MSRHFPRRQHMRLSTTRSAQRARRQARPGAGADRAAASEIRQAEGRRAVAHAQVVPMAANRSAKVVRLTAAPSHSSQPVGAAAPANMAIEPGGSLPSADCLPGVTALSAICAEPTAALASCVVPTLAFYGACPIVCDSVA